MSGVQCADLIVIGSGIVGSSTAYYAAQKGMSVIVIDKDGVIGNGASSRNGGGVRVSGRDAREIPFAKYAVENIWPTLGEELDENIEYHQAGNVRFAFAEKDLPALENIKKTNEAYGVGINIISAKEAKELCPYVGDSVTGAAVCDIDGSANPLKTTLAMYRAARRLGVKYYSGEEAVALQVVK